MTQGFTSKSRKLCNYCHHTISYGHDKRKKCDNCAYVLDFAIEVLQEKLDEVLVAQPLGSAETVGWPSSGFIIKGLERSIAHLERGDF